MEPKYGSAVKETSPGKSHSRKLADEAMTGTHYTNQASPDTQNNTMAMTKQQFIEYQRLKQQINKNIKKNTNQNFYLSDSPDAHRTINRRVQSITDEIAKQRQYLPQFSVKERGQSNLPPAEVRRTDNKTQNVFTPNPTEGGKYRNSGLSYSKNANVQFAGSPEAPANFGGNLGRNTFNDNLELFQNQQNLQTSLLDRAGRGKNKGSYQHEDVFNNQQVAQTRKKMINMMENMPSTIGIFSGGSNRPDISFLNDSLGPRGGAAAPGGKPGKSGNRRLQSSFSRHDSQPKYATMNQKTSKMSTYNRVHDFAAKAASKKKPRRNINNAYFDHVADEMAYNLNRTQMDMSSQEAMPVNLDYDIFEKPYGRKKQKNQSKTPTRSNNKRTLQEKWPLVMTESKLGFSHDEQAAIMSLKQKVKKLKSPGKPQHEGILKVPEISSPRRGNPASPGGSGVGYVNYVNGVPIEGGSPDPRRTKKSTMPKAQKLPKIRQSPPRDYFDDSTNPDHTTSKEVDFKIRRAKSKKKSNYQSNMRSKSPQRDDMYRRDKDELLMKHENIVKKTRGPQGEKHVSISASPLHSQSQQQINIILPKREMKELQKELNNMSPEKQLATVQAGIDSIRKIASAKSGSASAGILKKAKQVAAQGRRNDAAANTVSKSTGRGVQSGNSRSRYQSLAQSRGGQSSKERGGTNTKRSRSTRKASGGPIPPRTAEREPPSYIVRDQSHFKKFDGAPSLLDLNINQEDYEHLLHDDMDMISRHEVIYKILKDQLRQHQTELIKMKEDQKLGKLERRMSKSPKKKMKPIDLSKFARHIKHFELYGPQRGVAPEIKRIIKNLTCQDHHFMYCPSCKQYEAKDFDPIQNIQKFMDYVKKEQTKLKSYNRKQTKAAKAGGVIQPAKAPDLVEDSVSEITDLDQNEILHRYTMENMTEGEKKARERKHTQARLYGEEDYCQKHVCSTSHKHRPKSVKAPKGATVKVQLKEIADGVSMQDEENSAHQFSLHNKSMQADSEERLEAEMQTSAIIYRSRIDQTSKQDAQSMNIQTSEIEFKSNNQQTNFFDERDRRIEMACQTDPKMTKPKTPIKRNIKLQTEKPRAAIDMYKEDWVHSIVFKKAVKDEAIKRGLPFEEVETDDDEEYHATTETGTVFTSLHNTQQNKLDLMVRGAAEMKDQDPDTDGNSQERQKMHQSAIGFMKRFQEKGDIQMLSESEIRYIKKLLKEKNLLFWSEKSTLMDLHRHTKYTIRKVSSQMANIDNYQIFKRLKEPTREHVLYLVYRGERLYSAQGEAEKIFKLVATTLFDAEKFQNIINTKSIKKEDQVFIQKREIFFKRIMSLMNNFLEVYRLFSGKFTFKGQPLRDYLMSEIERVQEAKDMIDLVKKNNPELAKQEDSRKIAGEKRPRRTTFAEKLNNPLLTQEGETPLPTINERYKEADVMSGDMRTPLALKQQMTSDDRLVEISPHGANVFKQDGGDDELNEREDSGEKVRNTTPYIEIKDERPGDDQYLNEGDQLGMTRAAGKGPLIKGRKPGPQVQGNIVHEEKADVSPLKINKYQEQDVVGLQTIQAINQQLDQEQDYVENQAALDRGNHKSMAKLQQVPSSSIGIGEDFDKVAMNNQTPLGQQDDFGLNNTYNNPDLLGPPGSAPHGALTQGQLGASDGFNNMGGFRDESGTGSRTVHMQPEDVVAKPTPMSQNTDGTKDQGHLSAVVKKADQRPGTSGTVLNQNTPRLPGYDQNKIDEVQVEETEGNDANQEGGAIMSSHNKSIPSVEITDGNDTSK